MIEQDSRLGIHPASFTIEKLIIISQNLNKMCKPISLTLTNR